MAWRSLPLPAMDIRTAIGVLLAGSIGLWSCAAAPQRADPFHTVNRTTPGLRQLSFGAGSRLYQDENLGKLDNPILLALDYCEPFGFERLRLEGGLHYTYDEADDTSGGNDVRLKGETLELSAGLNGFLRLGRLRPYAGFGGSLQFLNLRGVDTASSTLFDDDDAVFGGYVKGGILFDISPVSHFGVEYRHFEGGDASLDGSTIGTGYDQFLLVFGTSFE